MLSRPILLSLLASCLAAQNTQPLEWRAWLNRGVTAFKSANYAEASADFQKAVDLNPNEVTPRLYLATSYMQLYIPGAESEQNQAMARKADAEFRTVLAMEPGNRVALTSVASLSLNQRKWDEARDWYQRLTVADPNNAEAYYSMGFIAWSKWYPAYGKARSQLGLRQEDPGPIADVAVRTSLRSQYWPTIEEGIWALNKALELNPQYDDAMAYMNLLIRERADLRDTREEYTRDIADADQWVQKTLETKKMKAQRPGSGILSGAVGTAPPPPPPPPPPPGSGNAPQRIMIGEQVQQQKLIAQPAPVYPPLAQQARIQGTVRLKVVIAKDGSVTNIEVISGHPLLVPPALEAVRGWRYQTTLLNGNPVEVATTVSVNFAF